MKSFFVSILLLCIGSIFFVLTLRGVYGNLKSSQIKGNLDQQTQPFELSPERGRYILTQNLFEHHSLALSQEQADAAYPDDGVYHGRFYIEFAPGMSLFALPLYQLGLHYNLSQVFSFLTVTIFAILNVILLFLIAYHVLKLPAWASILSSLIFGFGSIAWSYSGTLYQHQTTTFFILSSFYATWQYKQHKTWGFFWGFLVWLNYSLAVLIDYPNVLLVLPTIAYFFFTSIGITKKDEKYTLTFRFAFIFTSLFFLVVTALHAYSNELNFGGWLRTSGTGLVGYSTLKKYHINPSDTQTIHAYLSKRPPSQFFKEDYIIHGLNTLLIAPDKGIFIFNPIFLLSIFGIILALKKIDLEKGVLLSFVVVNLLLYASWNDPWGGWAFGPRYLIPSMAVLSLFISYWLTNTSHKILSRLIIFPLFVFSSAVSLLGALTTNAVPPITEAIPLHSRYGFPFNIPLLEGGKSSSFIFNTYLQANFSLLQYYCIILTSVIVIFSIVLYIVPLFTRYPKGKVAADL